MKWPGSCDPVAQNCSPDLECDVDCSMGKEFRCLSIGTSKPGEKCWDTGCVRGSSCMGSTADTAVCRQFCNTDADCPGGKKCDGYVGIVCKTGDTMPIGIFCAL